MPLQGDDPGTFVGEIAGPVKVRRADGGIGCSVTGGESFEAPLRDGVQAIFIEAAEPFEIHATEPFVSPPGDSTSFVATSEFDLTNHQWFYRAGDTLPQPQGLAGTQGFACQGNPNSCSIAPAGSGRAYLIARVNDGTTTARHSDVVWVRDSIPTSCGTAGEPVPQGDEGPVCPPPADSISQLRPSSLQLTCPPSVIRANTISCIATDPANGLDGTTVEWSFRPDPSRFYPNRPPTMLGFEVNRGPVIDSTWQGRMVHPGEIAVRKAGEDFALAQVKIDPRDFASLSVVFETAAINSAPADLFRRPQPEADGFRGGLYHDVPYVRRPSGETVFGGSHSLDVVPDGQG